MTDGGRFLGHPANGIGRPTEEGWIARFVGRKANGIGMPASERGVG